MTRHKMDPAERLKGLVAKILDGAQQAAGICPGICNEFADHTLLKLVSVHYMLDIYCLIMKDRGAPPGFKTCVYLDLMAGSGVTRLKGRDLYALGSPLMAARLSMKYGQVFDKIVCTEMHKGKAVALGKRLETLFPDQDSFVHANEIEDVFGDIMGEVREKRAHTLTFADYQGLKGIGYDNLRSLLDNRGDVMVTFMPSAITRAAASNPVTHQTIQHFWGRGDRSWMELLDDQAALTEAYKAKLAVNGRIVKQVRVKSETTGFSFVEFFSVWKTYRGSPWISAVDDLQDLYDAKPEILSSLLDVEEGKQDSLDNYP